MTSRCSRICTPHAGASTRSLFDASAYEAAHFPPRPGLRRVFDAENERRFSPVRRFRVLKSGLRPVGEDEVFAPPSGTRISRDPIRATPNR
jgi:hypothetical protein